MCGIYASSEGREKILGMLARMRHRGPDGFWSQRAGKKYPFEVGVARLAITQRFDYGAMQPFLTPQGRIVAFNGELYNYQEHRLDSDSEVQTLAMVLEQGQDPRLLFDGDFAALYYEPSVHRVTLYRDRFGVCPLYYQTRPFVAVSSEARRLARPRMVPPNGKVIIDLATRTARASWIPIPAVLNSRWERVSLLAALRESVRSRIEHSDSGRAMLMLSGGLDSTLLAHYLTMHWKDRFEAVCVYVNENSEDLISARVFCASHGVRLHEYQITYEEVRHDTQRILEHFDMHHNRVLNNPLRWGGGLRTWYAAKVAHQHDFRVMLGGDGADELFGGYGPSRVLETPPMQQRWRLSLLRSMSSINLDRANKLSLAHSVEYRVPYLSAGFSQLALSIPYSPGKAPLRAIATHSGLDPNYYLAAKYSNDEVPLRRIGLAA